MLQPVVSAGPGLAGIFLFRGGTVSHGLVGVGVGADIVGPLRAEVTLGFGVGAGLGAGAGAEFGFGFRFGFWFGFGFGVGIQLSYLPGCRCWCSSGFSGPPGWIRPGCIEAARPLGSVSALLTSFWPRSVAATALATMSMMPLPLSRLSW